MPKKKTLFTSIATVALLIAAFAFVIPRLQDFTKPIPFGQSFESIDELAKRLNTPTEILDAYLAALNITYEDFVDELNKLQVTPEQFAANTLQQSGYSFADFIQMYTLINNAEPPDEAIYDKIATGGTLTSETANIDVYLSKSTRQALKKENIEIHPTTDGNDKTVKLFHLFALLSYTGGDIPTFVSAANEAFCCQSVEITNVNIYCNYGFEKPENDNAMISDLFNIQTDTNNVYKAVAMPVLTLKFDDETQNITFGVVESLGILFTADNVTTLTKLSNTDFFDIHIRQHSMTDKILENNA